jgi:ATP-binding cassette subfamily B protein
VNGVHLVKTLGTGPLLSERFTATSTDLVSLEVRSQLAGRWRMATMGIIFAAIPALIYLAAGLPATSGGMTIGTLVAFTALQSGLFRPLSGLLDVGVSITSSMALFSRVFEYLDLTVEIDDPAEPAEIEHASALGEVHFDHVSFTYPDSDRQAIDDVDVVVPAGSSLALVGESGSGKTTLASMVARLYDATSGRIVIDGVDIRDMTLIDLSKIVGVVSQETYLLHTTIRENLRYAKPDATEDEMRAALTGAQIMPLIESLPEGLDTFVGDRGYRLSGGEKQRLAIARLLLKAPDVVVLDEATAHLDSESEVAVQRALKTALAGRTSIVIAHRLSTVRDADQILVIEGGTIVQRGRHQELLDAGGLYADLYRTQFRPRTTAEGQSPDPGAQGFATTS